MSADLDWSNPPELPPPGVAAAWAKAWSDRRAVAKRERNFKLADEIRDRLKAHGFEIRDTKDGSEVVRVG
jgi:cysteinyl-tRNA synthetase